MALYGTAKSELSGAFGKLTDNKYVAWGLIIGCGYIAIRFVNGGLKGFGAVGSAVTNVIDKQTAVSKTPGASGADYDKARVIATDISKAFGKHPDFGNWFTNMTEDEDAAILALNRIPNAVIGSLVKQIYRNITGSDLYSHVTSYLWDFQMNKINATVIPWIQ